MAERSFDPLASRVKADIILKMTASQLREVLQEAAGWLAPFPTFWGSSFVRAIEVEPKVARNDLGCVVVCPDGNLYEYLLGIAPGGGDGSPFRNEETKELNLPPQDYIPYAYSALLEITRLLQGQEEQAS